MKAKAKFPRDEFVGNLEHRGGKKLGQLSTEFFHKKMETRKHPPGGYRGYRGKKG